jgi:pyruvate-formate lyase-activating enzyme
MCKRSSSHRQNKRTRSLNVMPPEIISNSPEPAYEKREVLLEQFDSGTVTPPFPKVALVELSNACNHACVFCASPRMERKKRVLNLRLFERFVREAVGLGLEEIGLYSTGEPFVTKNLDQYVAMAKQAGIRYIFLTTNGSLATPDRMIPVIDAGLSSIKFSVNAGSRESYAIVHGHDDFDKVLENMRFLFSYRQTRAPHLKIFASCVVTRFVEPEKECIRALLLPLVDDLVFFGVDGQSGQSLDQLPYVESSMSPPVHETGQAGPCAMLWNRLHVTCEGYLTLCCVDYENALTYADLNMPGTILGAWNNATIVRMRERHKTQELRGTLCQKCLYGTKDAVNPLTTIGHEDMSVILKSSNNKGVESVTTRLVKMVGQ